MLCQIIRDLVPPNEILTKVIKEFLAINHPHCDVIAMIVYQVSAVGQRSSKGKDVGHSCVVASNTHTDSHAGWHFTSPGSRTSSLSGDRNGMGPMQR